MQTWPDLDFYRPTSLNYSMKRDGAKRYWSAVLLAWFLEDVKLEWSSDPCWLSRTVLNGDSRCVMRHENATSVVVWRIGISIGHINEVNMLARLVLGWVTVFRQVSHLGI